MVFASDSAVLIRSRTGRNVLLQSRGLDVVLAQQAAQAATGILEAAAQAPDPTDIMNTIQGLPLLCGSLQVLNNQYLVVYKVVAQMVFMVVAEAATANAFSCLNLVNSLVKVVLNETKAVDMAPEKIERKYSEIYLAIDALLNSGGILDASTACARAHATLEGLSAADKAAADKGDKGAADKAPKQAEGPHAQQLVVTYRARRTINSHLQQLARVSFSTGSTMRNVRPKPGFELQDSATAGQAAPAAPGLADPFGAAMGVAAPAATAASTGVSDDDIFDLLKASKAKQAAEAAAKAAAAANADPFAASADAAPAWTAFDGADPKAKAAAAGFEDNAFGELAPPLIPPEPVLQLREVWQGEVAGGRLVRARLDGRVEWVSEAAKAQVNTVQFTLEVPDQVDASVRQALSGARRHETTTRPGAQQGVFVADGPAAKPQPGVALLRYHVAATSCCMPLQVHFGATWQAMPDGQLVVTAGLQYLVNPKLALPCGDLSVDISLPALLEAPLHVEPAGATFDGAKRSLRWQVPGMVAGRCDALLAVFVVSADEAALAPALRRMVASVMLSGKDGTGKSLTGVELAQGVVELEETPGRVSWQAQLTATLAA